jgi:hypothetical protein
MDRTPLRGMVLNALILLYRYWPGWSPLGKKGPAPWHPGRETALEAAQPPKADDSIGVPRKSAAS